MPLGRERVWALMPVYDEVPDHALIEEVLEQTGGLTLVDDGSPEPVAGELEKLAAEWSLVLLQMGERRGKGAALRAGFDSALAQAHEPEALLTIDADGQHPASAIPAFLAAAADAELVIGDRFDDLGAMPWPRRLANRTCRRLLALATGRSVRDTQCGMRLLRGRALQLPLAGDGYEAEMRHLKASLENGFAVAWVPIPAIYGDETSSFRPLRDSVHVLAALVRPVERGTPSPIPLPHRRGFRRRHPTSSAPLGTRAIEQPEPQAQGSAL
jgi:glycosyltransferase involved in cell wall biosynthesis